MINLEIKTNIVSADISAVKSEIEGGSGGRFHQ
jgi:hypothetical protein